MKFPTTHGKYLRDSEWRKNCSICSKRFWRTVDKEEMSKQMSKGWTQEKRTKQSKLLIKRYKQHPELAKSLRQRMKIQNPMFNKKIKQLAMKNWRKTMELKKLLQNDNNIYKRKKFELRMTENKIGRMNENASRN